MAKADTPGMSVKGGRARPEGKIASGDRKRREFVVGTLIGVAGLIIGGWSLVASLRPSADPQPPANPVAECQTEHPDAQGQPVRTNEGQPQAYLIEGCRQPGMAGVGDDGFWRMELSTYGIPGAAMADPYTQVEVFVTRCPAVGLDYIYANQGLNAHHRMVVQLGQTVSGQTGGPENIFYPGTPEDVQDMPYSKDRLLVYVNGRYELESVSCEDVTAVTPVITYDNK